MATYTPITPVEITPGSTGWVDADLTSNIGDGHAGVALHVVMNSATGYAFGCRKNGSTDNRTTSMIGNSHTWFFVGLDSSAIAELNVGSTTGVDVYLVGYFDDPAVFNTNAWAKSPTSTTFTDRSVATDTGSDTAMAVFLEHCGPSYSTCMSRCDGSTDSRIPSSVDSSNHTGACVGVASEIFENRYDYSGATCHVVGYIKNTATDVTVNTNALSRTVTADGTFRDLSAEPPSNSVAAVYEIFSTSFTTTETYGLRQGGSSENIQKAHNLLAYGIVATEATSLDVEAAVQSSTNCTFYEIVSFQAGGTNHPLSGTIAGTSAFSAIFQGSVEAPSSVTAVINGVDVNVDWNDVTNADSYVVGRRIDGGSWTQVYP